MSPDVPQFALAGWFTVEQQAYADAGAGGRIAGSTCSARATGRTTPMADNLAPWGGWEPAIRDDPFGHFADARPWCPVQKARLADGHLAWIVLGYDAARQVLNDPRVSKDMLTALAEADLVQGYAHPLPFRVIGVGCLRELVGTKRHRPAGDLVSVLVAAEDGLTTQELLSSLFQLVAIDELIRFTAPVPHATFRVTIEPVTVDGVEIPGREQVLVCLGSANRDPVRFPPPDGLSSLPVVLRPSHRQG